MTQKVFLILTALALCTSFPSAAYPERGRVKVQGMSDLAHFIPPERVHPPFLLKAQKRNPNLFLHLFIPGVGRVRAHLNREKVYNVIPTITDKTGTHLDTTRTTLLDGTLKMKSGEAPVAAALYWKKSKPFLFLDFLAAHPRTGNQEHHQVIIPLQKKKIKRAFLNRAIKSCKNNGNCEQAFQDNPLTVPGMSASIARMVTAPATGNEVELNLDGDAAFSSLHGTSANSVLLAVANASETIYENDLGITYNITRQNIYTTTNFGSSDSENKLLTYQSFTLGEPHFGIADAYLLVSGEDFDSSVIGLAYLGTICRSPSNSFGIVQYTDSSLTPITFAHELGHIFDGEHTSSGIMAAVLSFPVPTSFSTESQNQVSSHITSFGSCLNSASIPDGGGGGSGGGSTPPPTGSFPEGYEVTLSAGLDMNGLFTATIQTPEAIDCTLELKAHKKKKRVINNGTVLYSTSANNTLVTLSGQLSEKTKKRYRKNRKRIKGHFRAVVTCANSTTVVSPNIRIKPSAIKLKVTKVGINSWINHVGNNISVVE